jgi:predicted metal-dependent phosphoesterase TrpH
LRFADPHCHTFASDGMVSPQELVDAAVASGLDLIAVTDHDTMGSVKEVQERGAAVGLTVVSGQEVTTAGPAQTHLLGWFLDRPVKRGMSLEDSLKAIHDAGGLAIVPHPFMPVYFGSIQPGMLRRLIDKQPVDGIEVMFTVPIGKRRRAVLDAFVAANRERLGAHIGASDCHFGRHDMGRVLTAFDGDFRTAVAERRTEPRMGTRRAVPAGMAIRQQWRALVEVPLLRARGKL